MSCSHCGDCLDRLTARIEELTQHVHQLTLELMRRRSPKDIRDAEIVDAIAELTKASEFTVGELVRGAIVRQAALLSLLDTRRLRKPHVLGRFLSGVEGRVLGHVRVIRTGMDGHQVIWRCEFLRSTTVSDPRPQELDCSALTAGADSRP